ncbi:MAG: adenine deaminase C-terminal domain-containing protein, partial [Pyramidobacter sp.]|nr:adenine deaminase C-terminal domain-containing protein [Pyramidobacter sp.]
DPHEIANTSSFEGLTAMRKAAENTPLDIFLNAPSCVPASDFETPCEKLEKESVSRMFSDGLCRALGEMMNYPGVIYGDTATWKKILASEGEAKNGHAPLLGGKDLCAYLLSRCNSDHECSNCGEAIEKLRRGCWVMLRQGAAEDNLGTLAPIIAEDERRASRCMLVSDDLTVQVLKNEGHIDRLLRIAVAHGVSPISALRMVTLNPAEFNRLYDRGAIAPGYAADMVLVEDLESFKVLSVWKNGAAVSVPAAGYPRQKNWPGVSHNHCCLELSDLAAPAHGKLRAIGYIPGEVITSHLVLDGVVKNGEFAASATDDIAKMAVVNRNTPERRIAIGFVKGIGLKRGALASSVAHDAHNFSILGMDDESMITAFNAVREKGGLAVADGKEVLYHLPLPIAGLMSNEPGTVLFEKFKAAAAAAQQLGTPLKNAFMVMSFLSLSVIPALKLTDQGYVDLSQGGLLPLNVQ